MHPVYGSLGGPWDEEPKMNPRRALELVSLLQTQLLEEDDPANTEYIEALDHAIAALILRKDNR